MRVGPPGWGRAGALLALLALLLPLIAGCGGSKSRGGPVASDAGGTGPSDLGSPATDGSATDVADQDGATRGDLGSPDAGRPPGDLLLPAGDGHVLAVTLAPLSLALYRGGALVAQSAAPFLVFGTVPQLSDGACYDPYLDEQGQGNLPSGLAWVAAISAEPAPESTAAAPVLALALEDGGSARLRLRVAATGRFALEIGSAQPAAGAVAFTRLRFAAPRTEAYYGLGESFARVQRRNTVQAMQFEVTALESSNNEAHVPIPFFAATGGWGLFVEDRHAGAFDIAHLDPQAVSATFASATLKAHLLVAADPLQVVAAYTLLTGPPAVPARWAFAPMLWRNEYASSDEVLADAHALRDDHVPGSTLWIDNPWQTAYNTFLFDPARFPDPAALVDALHALGFRLVVWSSPYLQEQAGEAYQEAVDHGYFVDYTPFFTKFGKLVDLTNPGAIELWGRLIGRATVLGVEGFKLDYGEDVQLGAGLQRLVHRFANGEDERTMHHGYQLYYHAPYAAALPAAGGFVLARSGSYGDQAVSTTIWPGDLDNDFHRFGEEGHVGGLPSAIVGGLNLAASGFPFFASDIGGFRHGRPTAEVLLRWAAYAALQPIMQLGGGGSNHNPWDTAAHGDEPVYDAETLRLYRIFAELHMQLFPYAYTLAQQARATGMPPARPFGLAFPDDGRHPDFTYMYGDALLVSPSPDGRQPVTVPLPAGRWLDWWSGAVSAGRGSVSRATPLGEVPLYLAEGGIVPLLRSGVDTLAPASAAGVDSLEARPGPLGVRLFPAAQRREQVVFDGARIAALVDPQARQIVLELQPGTLFAGWQLTVEWRAALGEDVAPATASADGDALPRVDDPAALAGCAACWYALPAKGQLLVALPAGAHQLTLSPRSPRLRRRRSSPAPRAPGPSVAAPVPARPAPAARRPARGAARRCRCASGRRAGGAR